MHIAYPQNSTIIFGFDSAWTDSPKAPGAICAIAFDTIGRFSFVEPRLVSFAGASEFIEARRHDHAVSLVALDQPTIVPNAAGSRPVDKVAASLISFIGGGVQPANRGKIGMFCDNASIWRFLSGLNATEDPLKARVAAAGHFVIEVFPALALPGLEASFAGRLGAPRYNPGNRARFRSDDWLSVTRVIQRVADALGLAGLAGWVEGMAALNQPRKADQDKLDAALCALVGLLWRAGPVSASVMLGDLASGYMITPVSDATRARLGLAALKRGVAMSPPPGP